MDRLSSLGCALLVLVVALVGCPIADCQCLPPSWSGMNQFPGILDYPLAVTTWDPDGVGPAPAVVAVGGALGLPGRVLTWDGVAWQQLGGNLPGVVYTLAVHNGEIFAAGWFPEVYRWDGSLWVITGAGITHSTALTVFNGELVVAGESVSPTGTTTHEVLRWSPLGWWPVGTGMNGAINALSVYNGDLVAGGAFTTADGSPANKVARWDGTAWHALGTGIDDPAPSAQVNALTVYGGEIVAAGKFTTAGGTPATRIARWNGSAWQALGSGLGQVSTSPYVAAFALHVHAGELVVGGHLELAGGTPVSGVARWNGSAWSAMSGGLGGGAAAFATHGALLVVVGGFHYADGVAASNVALWDGTQWAPTSPGIFHGVWAMTVDDAGVIAASGVSQDEGPGFVSRWVGTGWQQIGPPLNGGLHALALHNGAIVAAGGYAAGGGSTPSNPGFVYRWTGSAWVPVGGAFNSHVRCLAVFNGDLIAGGLFTDAGGTPVGRIARWTGTSWVPLGSGVTGNPGANVNTLLVFNGELVAGGTFTTAGGLPASHVARWNGAVWQPMGSVFGGLVWCLHDWNGTLVAGGNSSRIGAWDGTSWNQLGGTFGTGAAHRALSSYGGELIAGGDFGWVSGLYSPGIARWNGVSWQSFGTVTGDVRALAVRDGALITGGYNISPSPGVARWSPLLPQLLSSQPGGPGTGVRIVSGWLVPGNVYYNFASPDLCPGGPGTGPFGGLCCNDVTLLVQQLALPLGTEPFHFQAAGTSASFGPYPLPVGFSFEAVSVDVTGGVLGCISTVSRLTVQ